MTSGSGEFSIKLEDTMKLEEEEVMLAAAQAEELDNRSSLDDSLTSLHWLQEFSILSGPLHPSPHRYHLGFEAPASPLAGDPASFGTPLTPGRPTAAAYSRIVAHGHCPDEVDYRTNSRVKPPYSYSTLICMAMQASSHAKITLSCIYTWITDNFCYFRHADPTWQNSIRHNLSLNRCFTKVPRRKDEPGKGGFWTIDPATAERMLSGAYKKRRMPAVQINPALQGRIKAEPQPHAGGFGAEPPGGQRGLCVHPGYQQLYEGFGEATGADQSWDPHLAEGTMLGSWPVRKSLGVGRKKKGPPGCRAPGSAKRPPRSASPLLSVEEQKELAAQKEKYDWNAVLDSVLSGKLSLVYEEDGTQTLQAEVGGGGGGAAGFEEEIFLTPAVLQSPWAEEDQEEMAGAHIDFLCGSTLSMDQLFDFGCEVTLEGDMTLGGEVTLGGDVTLEGEVTPEGELTPLQLQFTRIDPLIVP